MAVDYDGIRIHPAVGAINAADNELTAVRESAVYGLADDEVEGAIAGCERLRARVFDTELALVAEADERDLGRRLGAASTAAWLRDRFRIRPGDARRLVELANRTRVEDGPVDFAANVRGPLTGRQMPATATALAEGVISPEHVAVVGKIMQNLPAAVPVDQAQQAERDMAGFCRQYDPLTVAKLGDYLLHVLSTDTLDDREDQKHRRRGLSFNETTGGVSGTLTAEAMALLHTALDPLAGPNPAADGTPDPRSPGQRLADALVELARRAIAADTYAANHGLSHRVMLTIGLDTLTAGHHCAEPDGEPAHHTQPAPVSDPTAMGGAASSERGGGSGEPTNCPLITAAGQSGSRPGELLWGGAISAAAARRIACFAGVQRVILDPAGAVLNVGREFRTATPTQFAALIARDGGCAFPGCTRNPSWCIAHHITHWADGGETNLDNLVLLCTFHHTVVHHRGWDIDMAPDRLPNFYPPPWINPHREARRNNRPKCGQMPGPGRGS